MPDPAYAQVSAGKPGGLVFGSFAIHLLASGCLINSSVANSTLSLLLCQAESGFSKTLYPRNKQTKPMSQGADSCLNGRSRRYGGVLRRHFGESGFGGWADEKVETARKKRSPLLSRNKPGTGRSSGYHVARGGFCPSFGLTLHLNVID